MRNLADTIARLATLKAAYRDAHTHATRDRLRDLKMATSNPGDLRARTYIPQNLASGAPLVVVLHGCTQSAAAYDEGSGWSDLADRSGFALLFPEQQRTNNPNLCFNWFLPEDAKRDKGEAHSIREMIETVVTAYDLDRRRIFIVGLSAGGAMAAVMLACYPEVFAGGGIIAGLPYGTAGTVPEAFDRMRGHGGPGETQLPGLARNASPHTGRWPRISVWHGTADSTVVASNMEATLRQWTGLHGVQMADHTSENGHGYVRRVWHGDTGQELIESYTVHGMGHGTPLAVNGPDGYGKAGAYMLETGISSTARLARFWGIAPAADHHRDDAAETSSDEYVHTGEILRPGMLTAENDRTKSSSQQSGVAHAQASGIQKVIEDALRAAGLMK